MRYTRRIIDDLLDELLPHLSAVALEGAKGVGKTATASQRARTTLTLTNAADREAVSNNLNVLTALPSPVLIDEWQIVPQSWDTVRHAVDQDPTGGGRFLLAGSAGVAPGIRIHSGAGRIVSLRMRPLAFSERGLLEPTVSLNDLLSGKQPDIGGHSTLTVSEYTDEILASGFPGVRHLASRARNLHLDSYLRRIVEKELVESGAQVRRPAALTSWLAAYAAATSTDASWSVILNAATPGEGDKPARQTADAYREHLTRIFVLDPLEAWIPTFSPLSRLTKAPKHHLIDPALAARLVGVDKTGLLVGRGDRVNTTTGTWLGALFESLVTQSVRVYADAVDARVGHLRTKNTDHEIDLIVETSNRRVVAIEVKLADHVSTSDVRHLNWLHEVLEDRLADKVVVYAGTHCYRRADGVAVVPFALLGA